MSKFQKHLRFLFVKLHRDPFAWAWAPYTRQREGNENSVPRPFVCAGLFAHEKEEVRRKRTDQQSSHRRRAVREARLSGATARQKRVVAENVHDAEGEDAYPMLLQPAAPAWQEGGVKKGERKPSIGPNRREAEHHGEKEEGEQSADTSISRVAT